MRILITGGTGSLGRALVARWKNDHELRILSRNPHKQQTLQAHYGLDASAFVLADICDYEAVRRACVGQDILIHAAALKTVSQGEQFPEEFLRVNALGSQVVARAWAETHFTESLTCTRPRLPRRAVYINSDKAAQPINFYGCTKKIGEAIFLSHGFSSIRYGNVVESEGSFIHKWRQARAEGRPVVVRFPAPTRFFLAMEQAIDLIEHALDWMRKGKSGVFVPNSLEAFNLEEVAHAMTHQVNICRDVLQPGEKQHEVLIQPGEIPEQLDDMLSILKPGWMERPAAAYASDTAPLMSGAELLRRLRVSPLQEVFA